MYLYAVAKENHDNPEQIEYFLDEKTAKNRMICFAVQTNCIALIHVYEMNQDTPETKMKLVQMIHLDSCEHDNSLQFKLWQKQKKENISTDNILKTPEIMYDCLKYVDI